MFIEHPCYDAKAHFKTGRIHLPVAPFCNIQCNYCSRKLRVDDNRPGITNEILSPKKALLKVKKALAREPRIKIIAIAGPGDPLANHTTIETFKLIKQYLPNVNFCLSTNGLNLSDQIENLYNVGVRFITVTLNTVDPEIGAKIYSFVRYNCKLHYGEEAATILLNRQIEGIKKAVNLGMLVKINTVLIPGINMKYIPDVAEKVAKLGAYIMNVMPLIPIGKFADLRSPTLEELKSTRIKCEEFIRQWYLCKQCRADAVGVPGEEITSKLQLDACPLTISNSVSACSC